MLFFSRFSTCHLHIKVVLFLPNLYIFNFLFLSNYISRDFLVQYWKGVVRGGDILAFFSDSWISFDRQYYVIVLWEASFYFAVEYILKLQGCFSIVQCLCFVAQPCPTLWDPHELKLTGLLCPSNLPGKNIGVGCHFLFQGILLTQGLNLHLLCLLHCRQILYPLSHQESFIT